MEGRYNFCQVARGQKARLSTLRRNVVPEGAPGMGGRLSFRTPCWESAPPPMKNTTGLSNYSTCQVRRDVAGHQWKLWLGGNAGCQPNKFWLQRAEGRGQKLLDVDSSQSGVACVIAQVGFDKSMETGTSAMDSQLLKWTCDLNNQRKDDEKCPSIFRVSGVRPCCFLFDRKESK